ncbi:hypothetical protein B296_00006256 [Ensete ventricosum]|uniref:Uncharacterized protein n=1 Tax=Ensete ventricosum TaxID=4639 RepID=A0A426ZB38_ENSVE|nr:hypothetical protein B296_00006256 [Ensete ventricosum]
MCTRDWVNVPCVQQQLRAVVLALAGFRRLHSLYTLPFLSSSSSRPGAAPLPLSLTSAAAAPSTMSWRPHLQPRWGKDEIKLSLSLLSIGFFAMMIPNNNHGRSGGGGRRRSRDLSDSSNPFVDGALPTTALASAKSRFPPILGFRVSNLFLVSSFIAPLAVRARDLICAIGLSVEDHAADGCSG